MSVLTNKTERHQKLYGVDDIESAVDDALESFHGGAAMLAVSILSDAQEAMALGRTETARLYINRAKWIVSMRLDPSDRFVIADAAA